MSRLNSHLGSLDSGWIETDTSRRLLAQLERRKPKIFPEKAFVSPLPSRGRLENLLKLQVLLFDSREGPLPLRTAQILHSQIFLLSPEKSISALPSKITLGQTSQHQFPPRSPHPPDQGSRDLQTQTQTLISGMKQGQGPSPQGSYHDYWGATGVKSS